MLGYWIIISALSIIIVAATLIYLGIILKKSKIRTLVRSKTLMSIIKKICFALFALFLIISIVFFLTESMRSKYFYIYDSAEKTNHILKSYVNYIYDILPIPKKICATTCIENNKLICTSYKYTIIDLGVSQSYMKNTPVFSIIKERCLMSFYVGFLAYILQCVIGYPLGIYLAKKENKVPDKIFNAINTTIKIIPPIIYFYLFALLFMVAFNLPVSFELNNVLSYLAPLSALTLSSSLSIAYFVKKYITLELNKDYVKFAKSKGLKENHILYKHVLRNALIPFIRTIPASILVSFSGFYLLEASFNIPGAGLALIHAIRLKDISLMRGLISFFSFLSIAAFLIGDILTIIFRKKEEYVKEDRVK